MVTHADSQQMLAASIARAVQNDLAIPHQAPDIAQAVEVALIREARESERTLAVGRTVAVGLYLLFAVVAWVNPGLVTMPAMPAVNMIVAIVWLGAAGGLLIALRRGYYHSQLRRAIPAADAGALVLASLILDRSLGSAGGAPLGALMVTITACALIAFSGSMRLSRTAARFTTLTAVGAALILATASGAGLLPAVFLACAVFLIGLLSSRLTRVIRRVITNEIARVQLARLYDDAREAADAREEVLKIVSHDLRNPLSTIGMAAEMILETSDTDAQARGVNIIRRSSDRMNRLVQDLLDVAKLETGRLAIDVEDTDVTSLIEEATETLAPLARSNGLTLTASLPEPLPTVCIDRGRILQVLSNLVGNAIKFTPDGGSITLHARAEANAVRLAVTDTGPGIPPDQMQRLFARFWQATASDRRGLGLGLTIAKSIVEAHGGRIGADSRTGEGSEFWFTVPLSPPAELPPEPR